MSITLFHAPMSRSTTARWMLEEVGAEYQIETVAMGAKAHRSPKHLTANSLGKVPTLDHDGTIVTEVAAICAYLADQFPAANLAPKVDSQERGTYYRWIFFTGSALEPALIDKALEREPGDKAMMPYGDFDSAIDATAGAIAKGPFLLGEKFSAADVVLGAMLRWTMIFDICPKRPEFVDYVARLEERPAMRRQIKLDDALASSLTQ
ncbi:MAG: glutathione S-transferase family protein [Hyphomicrobiaceae bacterium]